MSMPVPVLGSIPGLVRGASEDLGGGCDDGCHLWIWVVLRKG